MKKHMIACLLASIGCLGVSSAAAENLGECALTGYTFMGGWMGYENPAKDYFMVGSAPATEPNPEDEMWAFAWLKFEDLPETAVDEAWLSIEKLDKSGMIQPSAANPMDVSVQAVDADVAAILDDIGDFKENHILDGAVDTVFIGDPGVYSWDITSLVNDWITTGDNHGLVLTGWDNDSDGETLYHPYFGGLPDGGSDGTLAPTLSTVPIPEPSTVMMLGLGVLFGLVVAAGRRQRA